MTGTPRRVSGPALITNSSVTKYTVPTGVKAWTRHIHVSNPSASSVTFTLGIGSDTAAIRLYDAYVIAAGTTLDYFGRHTLAAAEIITATAGTTNILVMTIDCDEVIVGTPSA